MLKFLASQPCCTMAVKACSVSPPPFEIPEPCPECPPSHSVHPARWLGAPALRSAPTAMGRFLALIFLPASYPEGPRANTPRSRHRARRRSNSAPLKTADDRAKPDTTGRRRNQSPHPVTHIVPPVVPRALMRPLVDASHPPYPRKIPAKHQTVRPKETSGTDSDRLQAESLPDRVQLCRSKKGFLGYCRKSKPVGAASRKRLCERLTFCHFSGGDFRLSASLLFAEISHKTRQACCRECFRKPCPGTNQSPAVGGTS